MVNGQPLGRENIKITIWWNLNIIETHFRIGLVPDMVWGIIILDNFVNILILGKSFFIFLSLAKSWYSNHRLMTASAHNPECQYSRRRAFHLPLNIHTYIHITLVKEWKRDELADNEKYLSCKKLHACSRVLLSTTSLCKGMLSSFSATEY